MWRSSLHCWIKFILWCTCISQCGQPKRRSMFGWSKQNLMISIGLIKIQSTSMSSINSYVVSWFLMWKVFCMVSRFVWTFMPSIRFSSYHKRDCGMCMNFVQWIMVKVLWRKERWTLQKGFRLYPCKGALFNDIRNFSIQ